MKLFYTFYDRSYGYTRAIVALAAGLALTIWPQAIKEAFIYVLGGLILAAGAVSLILAARGKWKTENAPLLSMNGIVDLAFGLVLILFPSFFANFIVFLFGLLLLLFGGGSLISFLNTRRQTDLPWIFGLFPGLITLCGIAMFFFPSESGNAVFLFFGIALTVYGISEFIETYLIRRKLETYDIKRQAEKAGIIEDVPFEEETGPEERK